MDWHHPHKTCNFLQLQRLRETQEISWQAFASKTQVTKGMINRLGVTKELEGHSGCVNCLEFNTQGNLLLSGSDDYSIILWDPFRHKRLRTITTGHRGNIFSVKFLPFSQDNVVISGAGDGRVEVRELETGELTHVCTCHPERVKRIATGATLPHTFFSASEDGTVLLYDMRVSHACTAQNKNVLINLRTHTGRVAECKCITLNPLRPELLALGANDPYVRIYDRRMIKLTSLQCPPGSASRVDRNSFNQLDESANNLPPGCVQYFVPGHLPSKLKEYCRLYRNLAITYLVYSQDGKELLVNLGGEHIYLFNTLSKVYPKSYHMPPQVQNAADSSCKISSSAGNTSNGICKPPMTSSDVSSQMNALSNDSNKHPNSNGFNSSVQGPQKSMEVIDSSCSSSSSSAFNFLTTAGETLKARANQAFAAQQYTTALQLFNEAIYLCPKAAVLYSNRAATYMKRNWEGDVYSALRDCFTALEFEPSHIKALFRLARCLHLLGREEEAQQCLLTFQRKHKDHTSAPAFASLELEITSALVNKQNSGNTSESESEDDAVAGPMPTLSTMEEHWRKQAGDYDKAYRGHCNTTTDIKEASFVGKNGQYIAAGSDDGNLFIWDRHTTNIVRVLKGDESIVNCVQPHPHTCLLATSGIEAVVKLWSPLPEEEGEDNGLSVNILEAARANQQRMSTNPLEVMMLLNMGNMAHHIFGYSHGPRGEGEGGGGGRGSGGAEGDVHDRNSVPDMQCRTS